VVIQVPEDTPELQADPALLERAIANLVQNALRHSPPGAPPEITASAYGTAVEIRVIDCGPGILERIGIKFSCHSSGSGIGLALSRGLVEAMSGNLRPEETPGGGLTMTISLPAVPADTMTSRKAAPQQASLATSQPKRRASDHDPRARRRR
jgi:two-component system sensor histidine kinase KdpD